VDCQKTHDKPADKNQTCKLEKIFEHVTIYSGV